MPLSNAVDHNFGVVIPAKPEHLHWVKGTCASIRYFMDDTPICVLLDGDEFPDDLRETYDIQVVRRQEIENRDLRDATFGSLRWKNTALWASPFRTYLSIDADAIVWGDMRLHADFERFDFIVDSPMSDPELIRKWVMDVNVVGRRYPTFNAQGHFTDYVNTGVTFARRGLFDVNEYLELARFAQVHPGALYGDQGLLNLLLFRAADEGRIRLGQRELQVTTGDTTREEVTRRFAFVNGRPHVFSDPVVLHWAGSPKPRMRERGRDYFEPMTFFRREYRRAARDAGRATTTDEIWLRYEDMMCRDWRGSNMRGRFGRLRRRCRQRYTQAKVAIRARTPNWLVATVRRRSWLRQR